ncbi:MAG: methylenetetrahydrofolate reductase [NAD(P)H] [Dehalococcoidia bacterium]
MKISDLLSGQGRSISFEFFPPKTQAAEAELFDTIRRLESFKPAFVSVTCGAGGSTTKNTHRLIKRIKEETSLNPMPHLTCVGQSREELASILSDYKALGIENVLALRGDLPEEAAGLDFPENGLTYAKDLVQFAASFEAFSIGVAVYPEGHPEAPSPQKDLLYAKQKIDAGADFAITQMFFDNQYLYDLIDKAQKIGITVPIIPGIMPITDIGKIKRFSQMCGATLPSHLTDRMEKAKSPEQARKIGVDLATEQCEDLLKNGVRYLHFYTLNRDETVSEILHDLGIYQDRTLLEKDNGLDHPEEP